LFDYGEVMTGWWQASDAELLVVLDKTNREHNTTYLRLLEVTSHFSDVAAHIRNTRTKRSDRMRLCRNGAEETEVNAQPGADVPEDPGAEGGLELCGASVREHGGRVVPLSIVLPGRPPQVLARLGTLVVNSCS